MTCAHALVQPYVTPTCICIDRYGSGVAYAPHSIHLAGPSEVMYTSDGSTPVDFSLWVTDIAGQNMSQGKSPVTCYVLEMTCTGVEMYNLGVTHVLVEGPWLLCRCINSSPCWCGVFASNSESHHWFCS